MRDAFAQEMQVLELLSTTPDATVEEIVRATELRERTVRRLVQSLMSSSTAPVRRPS